MLFFADNPVDASSLPGLLKDKEGASFEAMTLFVEKAPSIDWKKDNIYGLMKEIMDEKGVKVLHPCRTASRACNGSRKNSVNRCDTPVHRT